MNEIKRQNQVIKFAIFAFICIVILVICFLSSSSNNNNHNIVLYKTYYSDQTDSILYINITRNDDDNIIEYISGFAYDKREDKYIDYLSFDSEFTLIKSTEEYDYYISTNELYTVYDYYNENYIEVMESDNKNELLFSGKFILLE